ncbi:hypothetical protein ABOM_009319 [Aspergillus bombycis]|uniref:Uncharacterized protein n=1 Tax=Aspergillus bombycis TaxID=109264 RepID=A0A1F7ZU67_9EURO|nr:hypothetical protein ABOM_009319 [Aspergillus bombycis]OGM43001.1 hypothetical protein ABOM_009319 [Aspergillus bombycis]
MSSQEQTQAPQFGEERKIRVFGSRNGRLQTDCDDKDGRIALKIASLFGNADIVQNLLEERALINSMSDRSSFMQQTLAAMHFQRAFSSLVPSGEPARAQLLALVAGCTPLICAAEGGHTAVVQMLLENGEDVNERDTTEKERSPIHLAALNGHVEVVKLLLERGANVEAQDMNMNTPLCLAVATCQAAVVDLLLEYNAKVNVRNSEGRTPLAILVTAAPEGQGTTAWRIIMQRLIADGSDLEARIESSGYTPLILAASHDRIDIIEQLLEAGANTEARNSNHYTALFEAVFMGNPRMVELLLDHKAKPVTLDKEQETPLGYAVALGSNPPVFWRKSETFDMPGVVDVLLKSKPDLLLMRNTLGQTPAGIAIYHGNSEMVELLLRYSNSNTEQGILHMPLLCQAALESNEAMIEVLIQGGVSLLGTDGRYGRNALSWAASRGNKAAFTRLLQAPGCGWDNVDRIGRTALFYAVVEGHTGFFEELRSRGGDIHRPDRFGLTPLFAAVQHGHCNIVQQILETHPLNHEPQDRFGRSLTWWIQLTGHTQMRDLLTGYGMQLRDDGQGQQGRYQLGVGSNKATQTCDACTMSLSRDNRGVVCGDGIEKYRICHICCAFGATCEDFMRK